MMSAIIAWLSLNWNKEMNRRKENNNTNKEVLSKNTKNSDQQPYYERYINRKRGWPDDFVDYSGGMLF